MASRCQITGKGKMYGHNPLPNSQHKTNRAFKPNLQKKTFVVNGQKVTMTIATSTLRTLKKKGFSVVNNTTTVKAA
ncbi:MAG: 50S ribosomal protein L28 [Candidatus Nomurabacteria bacterium]|nr:50S ribosomal protein L28 [Candidatus Nomurabacteria bacterium]